MFIIQSKRKIFKCALTFFEKRYKIWYGDSKDGRVFMVSDRYSVIIDGIKIASDSEELPADVFLTEDLTPLIPLKNLEKLFLPWRRISD